MSVTEKIFNYPLFHIDKVISLSLQPSREFRSICLRSRPRPRSSRQSCEIAYGNKRFDEMTLQLCQLGRNLLSLAPDARGAHPARNYVIPLRIGSTSERIRPKNQLLTNLLTRITQPRGLRIFSPRRSARESQRNG